MGDSLVRLAALMGGEVGVESAPGQGSVFWFTVRVARQMAAWHETPKVVGNLAELHVLVVDDNATSLEILGTQFTTWGMRVLGVVDGQAALEAVAAAHDRGEPFDLAVLDFQMPGMDGGELGQRLKADPRNHPLPLVILTALGRPGDAQRFKDLGFAAYLNKPVRQSELYDTLALLMGDPGSPGGRRRPQSSPGGAYHQGHGREHQCPRLARPCRKNGALGPGWGFESREGVYGRFGKAVRGVQEGGAIRDIY
jgi:CheY-like chemotaxis protein